MAPTSQQQNNNGSTDLNRQEIQTAIAKAVELRALHAALTQGNSPTSHNARFPSPSPVSQLSAQDYPVFTPVSNFLSSSAFKIFLLYPS